MFRFSTNGREPSAGDLATAEPAEGVDGPAPAPATVVRPEPGDGMVHVRAVPVAATTDRCVGARAVPAEAGTHRSGTGGARRLADLGLPAHLVPPDGGLFPLVTLLESLPPSRLPVLRDGDDVAVVALESGADDEPATRVADELDAAGQPVAEDHLHVLAWPADADPRRARHAVDDLVATLASLRPRLVLLRTTPDCPPTIAFTACRAMPAAQLDLHGVQRSHRPASPLGWGAPVAFLDGRRAWPALIAAVLADHLVGGIG